MDRSPGVRRTEQSAAGGLAPAAVQSDPLWRSEVGSESAANGNHRPTPGLRGGVADLQPFLV
jgi:hypothetical protein